MGPDAPRQHPRRVGLGRRWVLLGFVFAAAPAVALANDGAPILPPESAELISEAFSALPEPLLFKGAQIQKDTVTAEVCAEQCMILRLSYPDPECPGVVAGDWCVQKEQGDGAIDTVAATLARFGHQDVWHRATKGPRRTPIPLSAAALGLATIIVPTMVGLVLGLLIGRRRQLRSASSAMAVMFVAPLAALMPGLLAAVGVWEALFAGLWLGYGVLVGGHRFRPKLIVALVASLGGVLLAEIAARQWLPKPPGFAPAADQLLAIPDGAPLIGDRAAHRIGLFPDLDPAFVAARQPKAGKSVVLHVGDSMVAGTDVAIHERFTTLLDAEDESRAHVNVGISGVALDYYFALADRWSTRLAPDLLVVHLYPGNDADGLLHPFGFCDGPLFDMVDGNLIDRCPEPRAPSLWHTLVQGRSPCPYVMRVIANRSRFAAHLCGAMQVGYEAANAPPYDRDVWVDAFFANMAQRFEGEGTQVVFTLVPHRQSLERDPNASFAYEVRELFRAAATSHGFAVLDFWGLMQRSVDERGSSHWFNNDPVGDVHFGVAGHRLYADWLLQHLPH